MPVRRPPFVRTAILVFALNCAAFAQRPDPLPIDTGAAGLKQALRQLKTTARLLHTTAHPDDEDGGMLTFEARGQGVDTLLLTLTRGEGGQNKTGSNLFDELGVLRTLELLESDRYYGVQQRFTRVADFGFSKTAEETFQKWHGHDIPLADMVRVIRTFRPDVIVSRFQGADRDGHGNHQAAGILSREAFRAAADPNRFPEQLKEGLQPWQAKKLYMDNVRQGEDYTVRFETTVVDSVLGKSYAALGWEGLKHQLSQGSGGWTMPSGTRYATYKLVDSVLPPTTDKDGHEKSFFDGIDTTLPGLASRVPDGAIPSLKATLTEIDKYVDQATIAAEKLPYDAAELLLKGLELTRKLMADTTASNVPPVNKAHLLDALQTKQAQFERAANIALGVSVSANMRRWLDRPHPLPALVFAAGDTVLSCQIGFVNGTDQKIRLKTVALQTPANWNPEVKPMLSDTIAPHQNGVTTCSFRLPLEAKYTRPQFQRQNPETETTYDEKTADLSHPIPPPPASVRAEYVWQGHLGVVTGPVRASVSLDAEKLSPRGPMKVAPVAVGPAISILMSPSTATRRVGDNSPIDVRVDLTNLDTQTNPVDLPVRQDKELTGAVKIAVPNGWRCEPTASKFTFNDLWQHKSLAFKVYPAVSEEGRFQIAAKATSKGRDYSEGFSIVTREDLGVFYYYQPAIQKISAVNVQLPERLKIGYLMGAGDDIPTALQQLGLDVHLITPEELSKSDLSQFGTIVLGIRAYDTRFGMEEKLNEEKLKIEDLEKQNARLIEDFKKQNARLLDYVKNGGTLIVQYNASTQDFNDGKFTPYPAELSRQRVSVEEAPVKVLNPADPVFHFPNPIKDSDFDGWVQERGLNFMSSWDKQYEPLLSMSDPGEPPLSGGLLRARYGKGTYIYTGLAFFRQLPAGVPGAVRLFVNLLAAGHDQSVYNASNQSAR